MSWDVFLHRFSRHYLSVDDIAADERPLPLGTLAEVQAAVSAAFPVRWSAASSWDWARS